MPGCSTTYVFVVTRHYQSAAFRGPPPFVKILRVILDIFLVDFARVLLHHP